jgi:hypothetical protein
MAKPQQDLLRTLPYAIQDIDRHGEQRPIAFGRSQWTLMAAAEISDDRISNIAESAAAIGWRKMDERRSDSHSRRGSY